MLENLIILSLSCFSIYYLGNLVYRSFAIKGNAAGCSKGCGSCKVINFDKSV
ncbi:MAG: hypothetical protein KA313_01810 [Pseudarcicella sp.]|nr:hypothetical protein [Pseudarcicella sp.]MBP6409813.1 hypothetical protein [Pseudarcicella sp.]